MRDALLTSQEQEHTQQLRGVSADIVDAIQSELLIMTDEDTKERVLALVNAFKEHAPDETVVSEGIDSGIAETALPHVASKLERHGNTFKSVGRALFVTNKGLEWCSVTDAFGKSNVSNNLATLDPRHIAAQPWSEQGIDTGATRISVEDDLVRRISEACRQVRQNVPQTHRSKFSFIVRLIEAKTNPAGNAVANRRFIREQRAESLSEGMEALAYLLDHAEEIIITETLDRLPTKSKAFIEKYGAAVDEYVAWSNSDVWTPANVSTRAQRMATWLSEREAVLESTSLTDDTSDTAAEQATIVVAETAQESIQGVDAPIKLTELPWIDDAKDIDLELMLGHSVPVYIVRAMSKRMQDISHVSRESFARNSQGTNKFDIALMQQARRIAMGVMPYQDANSVKRLKVKRADMRPEYRGESFWYTFDITPNAPRVYFTVKKARDLLAGKVDGDALALVIVGESDKQRQLEIFTRFTTLSRTFLRNNGVGSI